MAGRLYIPALELSCLLPGLVARTSLMTSANQAPRRPLSMVRQENGKPCLTTAFWGLTPPWLKVLDHAPHCARAESLTERSMFSEAFQARRCLIPVGGVYVWKPQPRWKQPFLVTRLDRGPLLLAGIWCRYHTALSAYNDSTAVITVPSNALLAPLSDRLPTLIAPKQASTWLEPSTPPDMLSKMLSPAPMELLGAFPVSRKVNDPMCQDWSCAHPTGSVLRWQPVQET